MVSKLGFSALRILSKTGRALKATGAGEAPAYLAAEALPPPLLPSPSGLLLARSPSERRRGLGGLSGNPPSGNPRPGPAPA